MKFKTLMIIKAAVCLAFGPALVLIPGILLPLFGIELCPGVSLTAREYGAALVGNLFLTWLARDVPLSKARRAITWHLFIYDAVALAAVTVLQLQGLMNVLGWSIVAIYLFFSVGFGYFLLPAQNQS